MATEYGSRLRQARKHANLTQAELSKKTGIPQSTISTAEREGKGSGETPVYARACGVDALWLATGEGEMLDLNKNLPLAVDSIDYGAININANRRAKLTAHEVVAALGVLVASIDPAMTATLAGLLADFARSPGNPLLADMLEKLLEPSAFTQQNQRTG